MATRLAAWLFWLPAASGVFVCDGNVRADPRLCTQNDGVSTFCQGNSLNVGDEVDLRVRIVNGVSKEDHSNGVTTYPDVTAKAGKRIQLCYSCKDYVCDEAYDVLRVSLTKPYEEEAGVDSSFASGSAPTFLGDLACHDLPNSADVCGFITLNTDFLVPGDDHVTVAYVHLVAHARVETSFQVLAMTEEGLGELTSATDQGHCGPSFSTTNAVGTDDVTFAMPHPPSSPPTPPPPLPPAAPASSDGLSTAAIGGIAAAALATLCCCGLCLTLYMRGRKEDGKGLRSTDSSSSSSRVSATFSPLLRITV